MEGLIVIVVFWLLYYFGSRATKKKKEQQSGAPRMARSYPGQRATQTAAARGREAELARQRQRAEAYRAQQEQTLRRQMTELQDLAREARSTPSDEAAEAPRRTPRKDLLAEKQAERAAQQMAAAPEQQAAPPAAAEQLAAANLRSTKPVQRFQLPAFTQEAVANGIVMAEILGPCRARRRRPF